VAQVRALGAVAYLVKPLDVGQIVPTVDAAFARLRSEVLTRPPLEAAPTPAVAPAATAPDLVAMATGIVMHRYSVPRDKARQRLQRLADEQGLSLAAQAERVVLAVEELARTAE
jgi:response regulator NasT